MRNKFFFKGLLLALFAFASGCAVPYKIRNSENRTVPASYKGANDTINSAKVSWSKFFSDENLKSLIDTALVNNQELNIFMQEVNISRNEVRARKGQYLPYLDIGAGAGVEKVGRYTSQGASDAYHEIAPGKKFPEPLPAYAITAELSWEVDIWKKLRNSRKAAMYRYLASSEGRNFMVTNLIAEIANAYYELVALDNQLQILQQNIEIQQNALEIVKLEKQSAKVTELAVRKFEAEVLKNQSRQYAIQQSIVEAENRINFLTGRFPQPVSRKSAGFNDMVVDTVRPGIPAHLLENRPDVRQAEKQLAAAKLDVRAAKANFYPSLFVSATAGYQAFDPSFLMKLPESLIYMVAGHLAAPLINRNAIKAEYYSASSRQVQAIYNYEKTLLNAYIEVTNQLSNVDNLRKSYALKTQQVQALTQSIEISTGLFKSARADYMEVLMTQRDALESKFELIETKREQMKATINIYRALGGGWR